MYDHFCAALPDRARPHAELIAVGGFCGFLLILLFGALASHTDTVPAAAPPVVVVAAPPVQRARRVPSTAEPVQLASAAPAYRVRPGDTLAAIALRHGVGYQRLARANKLARPNRITPGQVLRLEAAEPGTRLIRPGDTLSGIAVATGLSVAQLRARNPWITNPDRIPAGAELAVAR